MFDLVYDIDAEEENLALLKEQIERELAMERAAEEAALSVEESEGGER
jgi:hypothetical protein